MATLGCMRNIALSLCFPLPSPPPLPTPTWLGGAGALWAARGVGFPNSPLAIRKNNKGTAFSIANIPVTSLLRLFVAVVMLRELHHWW